MIKSLSPHYVDVEWLSPLTGAKSTSYTLNVYVWNGSISTSPSVPIYSITKPNVNQSSGIDKVNISRLVNDFIDFMPNQSMTSTGLYSGNNQTWVKINVVYTTDNPLDVGVKQAETTVLMLQGYGYGLEGENPQPPTNKVLLQGNEFKVSRNGYFNLPILIEESATPPPPIEFATITSVSGGCVDFQYNTIYLEPAVTVERSTDGGVNWVANTGSPIPPRCGFITNSGDKFRLKSIGLINTFYSNTFTVL